MMWKLFRSTGVPFGIAMALYFGWVYGAFGAAIGLASGLLFGLITAAVLGGLHKAAGNTNVNAAHNLDLLGTPGAALEAGRHALKELAARHITVSANTLTARTRPSIRSWGELLSIEAAAASEGTSRVAVRSSPRFRATLVDYGKNQANVDALATSILKRQATQGAA